MVQPLSIFFQTSCTYINPSSFQFLHLSMIFSLAMPTSIRRSHSLAELIWPEPTSAAAHLLPVDRHSYAVRQAFLRSYRFTVRESFAERCSRSVREAGEKGKAVASKVFDWRVGFRVLRVFRSRLSEWRMDPFGCFVTRNEHYIEHLDQINYCQEFYYQCS